MQHVATGVAITAGLNFIGAVIINGCIYFFNVRSAIARLHTGDINRNQFITELLLFTANFGVNVCINVAGSLITSLSSAQIHRGLLGTALHNIVKVSTDFASDTFKDNHIFDFSCHQVLEYVKYQHAVIILSGKLRENIPLLSQPNLGSEFGLMRRYQSENTIAPNILGSHDSIPSFTTSSSIPQSSGRDYYPRSNIHLRSNDSCCCILQ